MRDWLNYGIKGALFALVFIGLAEYSHTLVPLAQAATSQFSVSWSAPTTYEDASKITGAITYQMYVGASGKEVKFGNPVTSPPYVIVPTPAPGVTTCVQVTSTVAAVESKRPTEVCGTVPFPLPNPPATTTITIK